MKRKDRGIIIEIHGAFGDDPPAALLLPCNDTLIMEWNVDILSREGNTVKFECPECGAIHESRRHTGPD